MAQNVALALSSGGARGFAQIGMIEVLTEAGYNIVSISGCSMGALVGGLYAAGGLEKFKDWACGLQRSDVFKLYDITFSSQGIIKGEKVFKAIEKLIPDCKIEHLPIPFTAVATDMRNQRQIIYRSGSLYDAFRASTSIPGVIKPVIVNNVEISDGGILNPLPIDLLPKQLNSIVVAADVNAPLHYDEKLGHPKGPGPKKYWDIFANKKNQQLYKSNHEIKKLGLIDLMIKATDLMQDQITDMTIKMYQPEIIIRTPRKAGGTFEYYKAEKLIDLGRKACIEALAEYEVKHEYKGN